MLRKWWNKYFCNCRQNEIDTSTSVASTKIALISCEQVWPPIPTNWQDIRSSYIDKFTLHDRQNEENNDQIFMIVLFLNEEILTKQRERINYLQTILSHIHIFTNRNQCIDFIVKSTNSRIELLISSLAEEEILSIVENLNQVRTIYILSDTDLNNHNTKIRSMSFEDIESVGKILLFSKRQFDSIAFTSVGVNQLDSSFMYSLLLKEILLELEYDDDTAKRDFIDYCRYEHADDNITLRTIDRFEDDYCQDRVIYWYSQPCFFFELLNRSLRTQDIEILVRISFMLRHLHKQIEHFHSEQISSTCFHVYRGQGMKHKEFEYKIRNRVGGLLSFNSFLSTSRDPDVAQIFVLRNDPDCIAVLFDIIIDGNISRCPFASLSNNSAISDEEEILFSMHSVFCIEKVEEDLQNEIWCVTLNLTSKDDQQLQTLTSYIRKNIRGPTGWDRLENLMIEMGKWNMVKPLLQASLSNNQDNDKLAYVHHQLGVVNGKIGDYIKAIEHYNKSLKLKSSKDLLGLASSHNGIGSVLEKQGKRSEASEQYRTALAFIRQLDQPDVETLVAVQNNIAGILQHRGKLLEALEIYQENLRLEKEHLPALHPHLAISYFNIASIYNDLNEWETSLKFAQKALDIEQRSLPSDHPSLAMTHSFIGLSLRNLTRNEEAVLHFQKTIEILSNYLPSDDPSIVKYQTFIEEFYQN